ncbi:MAG: LPXTG cell wall anchor domain-containing protein, partial [Oscillospiraceae bacterium]|nr:LPXTG cell wall anchor domain-containing protein [Oscillospiraceae bacterium]
GTGSNTGANTGSNSGSNSGNESNPNTGAEDMVGVVSAMAIVSAATGAALVLKKRK